MDVFENRPDVPLVDRVKIQAEVLVPLIKELEVSVASPKGPPLCQKHGTTWRPL
jgi:hypothetical protein